MIADETEARAFVAGLCDDAAMERLEQFCALLTSENERQNLIARATVTELWRRHIADSAQLLPLVPRETGPWLDLGTGAGFPGLVIAMMQPDRDVRLVESRKRRVEWLQSVIEALDLQRCAALGARLEQIPSFSASVISGRAFAPLPRLLTLSARFSTSDTIWLLPQGRSAKQELEELPVSRRKMFHVKQSLTDPESGILVSDPARTATAKAR